MFYAQKNRILLQVELIGKKVAFILKEPLELQADINRIVAVEKRKADRNLNQHHYVNNQGALGRQFRKQGWSVAYQNPGKAAFSLFKRWRRTALCI